MPSPFGALKRLFRGIVGTDALERRHADHDARMRRDLLLLGNALATARADPSDLERLPDYRRVAAVTGPCGHGAWRGSIWCAWGGTSTVAT